MKISDLPFMPEFFDRYIKLVDPNKTLEDVLLESKDDFNYFLEEMIKKGDYAYQPDKWTVKDVLKHIIDNERIQAYRALVITRENNPVLPGYDENVYAHKSVNATRTVSD